MESRLLAPKKNSLIDARNQTFVSLKGTAVSGWQMIKKKLYHIKSQEPSEKIQNIKESLLRRPERQKIVRIQRPCCGS